MARLTHETRLTLRAQLDQIDVSAGKELSVRSARYLLSECGDVLSPDELEAAEALVARLEDVLSGAELTRATYGDIRTHFFDHLYDAEASAGRLLRCVHLVERASAQREIEQTGLVVRHRHQPDHHAVCDSLLRIVPNPETTARWLIDQAQELLAGQS